MTKGFRNLLLLFLGVSALISCSEPQNFDQLDALQITPTYETSIFYVETQESLINRITGVRFFTQDFNFDAFEQPFFADRVLEGILTYELENTTSKPIVITLEFLDVADQTLDTETFEMDPAPTATLVRDVTYGTTGKSLDIIRNTSKIRLTAGNLGDNTTTSGVPNASIILKSSAQFTLELQ
ncbi:MAG: hypothetical protein WA810_10590 [Maribacter sp.]